MTHRTKTLWSAVGLIMGTICGARLTQADDPSTEAWGVVVLALVLAAAVSLKSTSPPPGE